MKRPKKKRSAGASKPVLDEAHDRIDAQLLSNAETLGPKALRAFVDSYYAIQEERKAAANRLRAAEASGEGAQGFEWYLHHLEWVEGVIKKRIADGIENIPLCIWAQGVRGIGPVLAAGLSSHVDFSIATNVSKLWRFCGLDPTCKWIGADGAKALVAEHVPPRTAINDEVVAKVATAAKVDAGRLMQWILAKGKLTRETLTRALSRRPYNLRMKVLCWKIGDSFVKLSNDPLCTYGQVYRVEKARLIQRNDAGEWREESKRSLARVRRTTDAAKSYRRGRLPPGRVDLMARRKVVKLFLSHWWAKGYELHYGKPAPDPWIIEKGGHSDLIAPDDMAVEA